tara:strand:+ start:1290 stop:1829 length:540 start_codon:yes stop_codon:yes gene_type:complete
METSLRFKCLLVWYKITRSYIKTPLIKIAEGGKGADNVLFFLPSDNVNAQITAYFVNQDLINKKKTIYYFVHETGLKYYPSKLRNSFITYKDEDLNWWGLIINHSVLNKVKSINCDVLVDLNQKQKPAEKFLIMDLPTKLKIGFHSFLSDELYNLTIKRDKSSFLEKQYSMIERILGLT